MMTSSEMRELIKYERQKGISTANNLVVELQRRNADSVTILILTIIGFAIASRKSREGTGLNLALGAGIGAIFVVTSRFAIAFSNSLAIDPVIGAWIPNLFFGLLSVLLLFKAQQ